MKRLARLLVSLLLPAFMLAGVAANSALAQDKAKAAPAAKAEKGKAVFKELFDNDKVRVFEVTFRPGDQGNTGVNLPFRVIRVLKGGTLMRTYADGTTEKVEFKTGEVKVFEAAGKPSTQKNVGKSDLVFYNVFLKEPKK